MLRPPLGIVTALKESVRNGSHSRGMSETGTDWRVVDGVSTACVDAPSMVEGGRSAGRFAELDLRIGLAEAADTYQGHGRVEGGDRDIPVYSAISRSRPIPAYDTTPAPSALTRTAGRPCYASSRECLPRQRALDRRMPNFLL